MLDLAIIGGGPAGLTAGLYSTRGGLKEVVMFEMGMPGGQITGSSEIENYPGQLEVVSGLDLMQSWPQQAMKFGLKHEMKKISSVVKNGDIFILTADDGSTFESKSVLLATGSVPRRAGFKGENEFFGRGISTCATCDGFFYKGKEVAVVGGGDSALEEAVYLSKICSKVYLVHRRDTYRAAPSTIEHMKKTENIEEVTNVDVEEVFGDASGVTGLKVKSKEDGTIRQLDVPGVFIFVGRDVLNEPIKNEDGTFICDTDDQGQVIVDLKMRTSLSGLYAAGDVRIDAAKQVVCAAGDGATAAVDIIDFLG
ncbi:thioredoxin-disulfide reductase [Malaciobacter molluscorum LMG 25693]|uniref:Thioredoxin reductase n=3 Tax=Malaciobacter molluscorum LMG 25693 TaxID=870501 RepID=A0A2G1DEA2_9BACT|nr:thioredoxin-disulfide reductase [Malaciobacter molluscorum]AXX91163.1 thioredoxin reductase [Malaciobacter molluscorum LMG 25693]AXX91302.1 thioredoxin reductase [Malaciobacter molluscorum LMG 25693]PHO16819.1 thioredoxin-disulfide reductase [Malaciobacter molluscorum LMG 25693]